MTDQEIAARFRQLSKTELPGPGTGSTDERHRAIFAAGKEDLSLAKLIEAHWDAVAILEEAALVRDPEAAYAVWASAFPGRSLVLADGKLNGVKHFCSGSTLVDRALMTAGSALVEIDLRTQRHRMEINCSGWRTEAFRATYTATITFSDCAVERVVGTDDWYTRRIGFWRGACGPAAAWAGGAAGLLAYAIGSKRDDPHTLAHLGAMYAGIRDMEATLQSAAHRFDEAQDGAMLEALAVRHSIEQQCSDILRRFTRALGPAPIALDAGIVRRCAELELFLRQNHAERDLEHLGRAVRAMASQGSE